MAKVTRIALNGSRMLCAAFLLGAGCVSTPKPVKTYSRGYQQGKSAILKDPKRSRYTYWTGILDGMYDGMKLAQMQDVIDKARKDRKKREYKAAEKVKAQQVLDRYQDEIDEAADEFVQEVLDGKFDKAK